MIPAGNLVFEYKSTGHEYFIILKGRCKVLYNSTYNDPKIEQIKKEIMLVESEKIEEKQRVKSNFPGVPKTPIVSNSVVTKKKDLGYFVYYMGKLMLEIDEMSDGDEFGSMALDENNKSAIRMAAILAVEDTHCAVLDRKSYLVIPIF